MIKFFCYIRLMTVYLTISHYESKTWHYWKWHKIYTERRDFARKNLEFLSNAYYKKWPLKKDWENDKTKG